MLDLQGISEIFPDNVFSSMSFEPISLPSLPW